MCGWNVIGSFVGRLVSSSLLIERSDVASCSWEVVGLCVDMLIEIGDALSRRSDVDRLDDIGSFVE